jgi:hypothetical protein
VLGQKLGGVSSVDVATNQRLDVDCWLFLLFLLFSLRFLNGSCLDLFLLFVTICWFFFSE